MMVAAKVLKYLDPGETEAEILLCCGDLSLVVYSCPYTPCNNPQEITLSTFLADNIVRAEHFRAPVRWDENRYSYHLTAKLIDRTERLVQIGEIRISLDGYIPRDIANGEYIEFDVARLEL